MHRNRVGREGVEHDQVVALGRRHQRQPRIAEDDVIALAATREKAEEIRVARDANHLGVDLEERPALAVALVAGDAAGAEADHRDTVEVAAATDAGRVDDCPTIGPPI